jgi:hypothetical protein
MPALREALLSTKCSIAAGTPGCSHLPAVVGAFRYARSLRAPQLTSLSETPEQRRTRQVSGNVEQRLGTSESKVPQYRRSSSDATFSRRLPVDVDELADHAGEAWGFFALGEVSCFDGA